MIGWTGKASLKCMTAPPAADGNIPPFNKTGHPLRKAFQSFAEIGPEVRPQKSGAQESKRWLSAKHSGKRREALWSSSHKRKFFSKRCELAKRRSQSRARSKTVGDTLPREKCLVRTLFQSTGTGWLAQQCRWPLLCPFSLLTGNCTGNFAKSRLRERQRPEIVVSSQGIRREFPTPGSGNYFVGTGNLGARTGILYLQTPRKADNERQFV